MDPVARAADLLRSADSALFITGAGISADSGLPTYRGVGGLYHDLDTPEGLPIEVVLSGQVMSARPELSWRYIAQIEQACRGAVPNVAHEVIAWLEERLERVVVLTQNVDGFHRAAGSSGVIPIHGDLASLRCDACGWRTRIDDFAALEVPPRCPDCGAIARPDVVLFGEMLPDDAVRAMHRELAAGFDVVFSVGTSSLFPYIAAPVIEASRRGVPTVEINPGDTEVSAVVDVRIRQRAAPAFRALQERLVARRGTR